MPFYDVSCPRHGVHEIRRAMDAADFCPVDGCDEPVAQHFSPAYFLGGRIDAGGEDVREGERVQDGSSGWNLGVPGVETVVGTRPDGKPKTEYRPMTNHELGSNRGVREYAKRHNLTPVDAGRYRTVGR